MENLGYIASIILIFGAVIIFHEAGHFTLAKLARIRIYEFAVGLGPVLFSRKKGETQYSVRAIPVGGMVRVAGLEGEEGEVPDSFNTKPLGTRIGVIAAGPLMNIVLAIIIFCLLYSVFGRPTGDVTNKIERVISGRPAAKAGLLPGDRLIEVNGIPSSEYAEMRQQISDNPNREISVIVERAGERLEFRFAPAEEKITEEGVFSEDGKELLEIKKVDKSIGLIGVVFEQKLEKLPLHQAVMVGLEETWGLVKAIGNGLSMVFRKKAPLDVRGPVGIVKIMYDEARVSWTRFLYFAGIFNLMVAFFNLIPFPALDGGRIVFLAIEGLRGRPVDAHKEAIVHTIGLFILLLIVLLVTVKDVLRFWGPN